MSNYRHVKSDDGTPIAYRAWGVGEPMLLVHGSATTGADWTFARRLLRERFEVVVMDRRGRGESGDAAEYAMDREVEDILSVIDAVGAKHLVAHSFGALCAMNAAAQWDSLERLVLYEPPIAVRTEWLGELDEAVTEGRLDEALRGFLQGAGASQEQLDLIRASAAWPVLLDAVPALPRELSAAAGWQPPTRVTVPTLYALGANTTSPAYLDGREDLLKIFTDVREELIPDQMHVAHVFAAEAFGELVGDFCSGNPSSSET